MVKCLVTLRRYNIYNRTSVVYQTLSASLERLTENGYRRFKNETERLGCLDGRCSL